MDRKEKNTGNDIPHKRPVQRRTEGRSDERRADRKRVQKAHRGDEEGQGVRRKRPEDARAQGRPEQRKRRPEDAHAQGRPEQRKRRPEGARAQVSGEHKKNQSKKRTSGRDRKKENQKRATFNVVSGIVLIVAVCVFVFSLFQLVTMMVPYYSGGKEYDKIKDIAVTADEDGTGFSVDFNELLKQNPDTVAWIRFDEPSIINYPVVKSADNTEYLTKTFTANDNKLGAIFMDMRNSNDFSDRNTMIYGHHLNVGGEMFSELLKYEDEAFCKKNPNFYIYTPDGKVRTYTVFSAGVVKDTAENYDLEYASDQEFTDYLKLCQESSNYKVDVDLNAQSQIVSLSTCTNVRDDERFLVQGVLTAEE